MTTYNFSGDGQLHALNESDGFIRWSKVVQRTDTTPAVAYGKVYVCGGCSGYSNSMVHCFDAETGALKWEVTGVGDWTASVAVADGMVFAGKSSTTSYFGFEAMYALDAEDGHEMWHYSLGGSSAAIANGFVYTIGDTGRVYAYGSFYADWDTNKDGSVNVLDMIVVGQRFGETGDRGWIDQDATHDGKINVLDMILIGQHWRE